MAPKSERGGAILEGIAALGVVLAFTTAILVASYLLFARAFLQFEGEQALLCLARSLPSSTCKQQLLLRLAERLPWGHVANARLSAAADRWTLGVEWEWSGCRLRVEKELRLNHVTGHAGLR